MDSLMDRYKIERDEEWREKVNLIPHIKFKPGWKVKMIPPFGGAIARFLVSFDDAEVSVYLDWFDNLGHYGSPYWEVHPYDDDVFRCDLDETNKLVNAIQQSIDEQLYNY